MFKPKKNVVNVELFICLNFQLSYDHLVYDVFLFLRLVLVLVLAFIFVSISFVVCLALVVIVVVVHARLG